MSGEYVEIEEADDARPGDDATRDDDDAAALPGGGPSPARRRRRLLLAAGALAVVAVLVAGVVGELRERAERARHSDVPGLVADLEHAPQERWALPPGPDPTALGGRVLASDGAGGLVAYDAATGEPVWTVRPPEAAAIVFVDCPEALAVDGEPAVVCLVPTDLDLAAGTVRWRLEAHAADDGRLLHEELLDAAPIGVGSVDGDLVLATYGGDGVRLERRRALGGAAVWDEHLVDFNPTGQGLAVTDGYVALRGLTTAVLDADDGTPLGRWETAAGPGGPEGVVVVGRGDAGFGVWTTRFAGRWHDPDGTRAALVEGAPAEPQVGDGSAPTVLLVTEEDGGELRAVDVTSGDVLWTRPAGTRPTLRLDGRVLLTTETHLTAVDLTTGEDVWTADLPDGARPVAGPALSDGLRIAVEGVADDGAATLTAYDVGTGARLWRTELPAGTRAVEALGDRVAVVGPRRGGGETVVVLG